MSPKKSGLLMMAVAITAPIVLAGTVPASMAEFAGIVDPLVNFFTSTVVRWASLVAGVAASLGLAFSLRQGGLGAGASKILNFGLGVILAGSIVTFVAGLGVEGGMVP